MLTHAIDDAVKKTRANIERFGHLFPHVSENGEYKLNDNNDWTNGFWSGILWLCYEYTKDDLFRDAARQTVHSFRERLQAKTRLDHHDIGFLYSLSSKAQWIVERDESARQLTLDAADHLMGRWRENIKIIQAWGEQDDPNNGGRIIIDCMMNLPLLYWAYEQTGNPKYLEVATIHADQSRRFLIRGDDSSYHTFYFDQQTGESLRGATHQGYQNGSTWTRGQAWGIYGFALSYRYTKNPNFLETSKRLARYFLERLPQDGVVYWDFKAPITNDTKRDSSASAITSAGLLEIIEHLPANDPDRGFFQQGFQRSIQGLVDHYSTIDKPNAQGFIERGSYSVRAGESPDDYMIWGDYYYLEALLRAEKGIKGYWYE
jgi:unsaturated chondroitin disaccharide hydrolase